MENIVFDILESLHPSLAEGVLPYILIAAVPLGIVMCYALVAILGELKFASFIQERLGPMRTGWKGVIQPLAEVVKLLQKEDITPDAADKPLFNIAPFIMFAASYASFAVIPFSTYFVPTGINIGLFYVLAVGSFAVIALMMGGWASNNKYSLLGGIRSVAQIISYEIPAAMCLLSIAVIVSSLQFANIGMSSDALAAIGLNVDGDSYLEGLNLVHINVAQSGGFWNWFIFGGPSTSIILKIILIPFMVGLFLIYLVSSLAETNRTPFDIPEGESEIVAGYHTEYSGMKFAMFFLAEYANMFLVSALIAILFFGGWNSPIPGLDSWWLGFGWFMLKALFFVFVQIWLRWTLPRLRVDQLMYVGWKVLLPMSFVCFIAISVYAMLI